MKMVGIIVHTWKKIDQTNKIQKVGVTPDKIRVRVSQHHGLKNRPVGPPAEVHHAHTDCVSPSCLARWYSICPDPYPVNEESRFMLKHKKKCVYWCPGEGFIIGQNNL